MFPGGGDPRQIKRAMKQLGVDIEQLDDVERVVIERTDSKLVFEDPQVSVMEAQGQEIYQIVGKPTEQAAYEPSDEDVDLVVDRADVSEDEAREALIEAEGDIADAVMSLS